MQNLLNDNEHKWRIIEPDSAEWRPWAVNFSVSEIELHILEPIEERVSIPIFTIFSLGINMTFFPSMVSQLPFSWYQNATMMGCRVFFQITNERWRKLGGWLFYSSWGNWCFGGGTRYFFQTSVAEPVAITPKLKGVETVWDSDWVS